MFSKPDISTYSDVIDVDFLKSSGSKSYTNPKYKNYYPNNMTQSDLSVKTCSWTINSYNISVSYTPTDSIYLNVISNTTFANWDGFVRDTDLESRMGLDKFYTLMTNCFNHTESKITENSTNLYTLEWEYNPSVLSIGFVAILDRFYHISERICLKEKVLSSDKVLTIKLTEMESRHQVEITRLQQRIEQLENEPIVFASHPTNFGSNFTCAPNSTVIDFAQANGMVFHGNYLDFNKLKGLNKIIIYNSNFTYARGLKDWYANNGVYYEHPYHSSYGNLGYPNSLQNIFNTPQIYLPNVNVLVIYFGDGSRIPNQLGSLPNLSKLMFGKFGNNQLAPFELIKSTEKLSHLIFDNCLSIGNLDQIKNWCDSKNIKLEIK
jgi:hypothetical protein